LKEQEFSVSINVGGSRKELCVSAPESIPMSSVAREMAIFVRNKDVYEAISKADGKPIKILTVDIRMTGNDEIVGIQVG
jgi:hypothetical protein